VEALQAGQRIPAALLLESHASLRDDFRCSTEPLDWFVESAVQHEDVTGARLTGAGWGGCAIAIGDREALDRAAWELAAEFTRRFGRQARWWITTASDGARAEPS
jgi:galactokinase